MALVMALFAVGATASLLLRARTARVAAIQPASALADSTPVL
jgi:hypothetical protein